jgi:Glycosyltransferase family 87
MRALITSPALVVLAILLVWSLTSLARINRFLSRRAILVFLVFGACANVFVAALAGYINPMDYVQEVVAAHQFLKHETMYPGNLPELGVAELSAPLPGREALRKLAIFQGELDAATFSPAPGNAHPPLLGIVLAAPVFLLGLRGSFLFVLLLSVLLLYVSAAAILRELFPSQPLIPRYAAIAFVIGWYPAAAALREAQPAIILFALITVAWLLLRRNRPYPAGGAIGLAACLQAFPALLVLFLAIRCRRAFVSALAGC